MHLENCMQLEGDSDKAATGTESILTTEICEKT